MKKTEPAEQILNKIPLQDRDSRWQGSLAQIDLPIKAARQYSGNSTATGQICESSSKWQYFLFYEMFC